MNVTDSKGEEIESATPVTILRDYWSCAKRHHDRQIKYAKLSCAIGLPLSLLSFSLALDINDSGSAIGIGLFTLIVAVFCIAFVQSMSTSHGSLQALLIGIAASAGGAVAIYLLLVTSGFIQKGEEGLIALARLGYLSAALFHAWLTLDAIARWRSESRLLKRKQVDVTRMTVFFGSDRVNDEMAKSMINAIDNGRIYQRELLRNELLK